MKTPSPPLLRRRWIAISEIKIRHWRSCILDRKRQAKLPGLTATVGCQHPFSRPRTLPCGAFSALASDFEGKGKNQKKKGCSRTDSFFFVVIKRMGMSTKKASFIVIITIGCILHNRWLVWIVTDPSTYLIINLIPVCGDTAWRPQSAFYYIMTCQTVFARLFYFEFNKH